VLSELLSLSVDLGSSVGDPDEVLLGGLDFGLNVFSMGGGFVSNGFILISNRGQVANLTSKLLLLGSIDFIGAILGIDVGLLEVSQESKCRIDGINSLALQVEQVGELGLELRSVSEVEADEAQQKNGGCLFHFFCFSSK
jgi:hypothetical protein